jgi:hypothetical protein
MLNVVLLDQPVSDAVVTGMSTDEAIPLLLSGRARLSKTQDIPPVALLEELKHKASNIEKFGRRIEGVSSFEKIEKVVLRGGLRQSMVEGRELPWFQGTPRRSNGLCWPSNETLAQEMKMDVRSIQRHLADLLANGWLLKVQIPRQRRGLQLAFPAEREGDKEHDSKHDTTLTELSHQHDETVTPYSNSFEPSKNQSKQPAKSMCFSTTDIGENETGPLGEWRDWIEAETDYEVEPLFELLRKGTRFVLPSRFPRPNAADAQTARRFFDEVVASQGRNLR